MAFAPDKIRNVAIVGHRGTGKTSLTEALLYESGEINRLGNVADGTTVSDHDDDERRRGLSISAALTHANWNGRKLNLIDTPGDPSFQADALGALRVVEGALFVVSGVLGVEVSTTRLWKRCEELGLARIAFVNLLDRERADFEAALESLQSQLSQNLVAISLPIGEEHGFRGVVDLLHMVAYEDAADGSHESDPVPIPDALQATGRGVARAPDGSRRGGLGRPDGALPRGQADRRRRARRSRSRTSWCGASSSRSRAAPPRGTSARARCST